MDPNPSNYPILSYVMAKLPSIGPLRAATTTNPVDEFDIEAPPPLASPPSKPKVVSLPSEPKEPNFELSERMPHLTNPQVVAAMRVAVAEVSRTRSVLRSLGERPDHETVDTAKSKLAEIDADLSKQLEDISLSPRPGNMGRTQRNEVSIRADLGEEKQMYKAVISLDEMHEAYGKMLIDAEKRLEKIYEAAVAGADLEAIEEEQMSTPTANDDEISDEINAIMQEATGKEIKNVNLSDKKLSVVPDAFFVTLRSLVVLNLSNNQLEAIPESIAGLDKLEELNLSTNLLESLPDSIGLLFNLKLLDISSNKLTALPDSICHCRSLVELHAGFNKLTYLPTNIGFELVNLTKLFIQLNKIRFFPTSIGEMKALCILDAHFNELHGLPASIGKLTNLEILNLSSNFSDLKELPKTIGDLVSLKELDLSNNQIHELPDTFGFLEYLSKLNVDQNPLVVPPKEVVAQGVEAVKAYMVKKRLDTLLEEEKMSNAEDHSQDSLLTRSTSWLTNVAYSVTGTVSGYLGATESPKSYLNEQL